MVFTALLNFRTALAILFAGAVLFSCAPATGEITIEDAIEKLSSGETVSKIEQSTIVPPIRIHEPETLPKPEDSPISSDEFFSQLRLRFQPLHASQLEFQFYKKKDPATGALRSSFNDAELGELLKLSRDVSEKAEQTRIAAHSLLRRSTSVPSDSPESLAARIRMVYAAEKNTADLASYFDMPADAADLPIFPFGLSGLIPRAGQESKLLSRSSSPYSTARTAWLNYNGAAEALLSRFDSYRQYRDLDNPVHTPPKAARVSIAFLDTGIDYVKFPELNHFLGESRDYADSDSNPWLPILGAFSHGTATATTLLSLTARLAPEVLRENALQIRMWKWQSLRQLLSRYANESGPSRDDTTWENRPAIQDAILDQISNPSRPKIVVSPVGFSIRERLLSSGDLQQLHRADWLWVMAAGNSGEDARASQPHPCLLDVPAQLRPRDLILCIGAAKMGADGPEIADYSNHGPAVDFYTLDTFNKICPSGTSCSAPVVGAAAGVLAAKYPRLSPKAIRTILRRASSVHIRESKPFRYFDPTTMMPRAYELAEGFSER